MNNLRWWVLLCAFNLLACSNTTPEKEGLLDSVRALQMGVYDARLQNRQKKLSDLKRQHDSQRQQFNVLKKETAIEARKMQLLQDKVGQEQLRKSRHVANIKAFNARQYELKRQLFLLDKSMKALDQQSLAETSKLPQGASSVEQLTKERDQLRRQLQLLIKKGI